MGRAALQNQRFDGLLEKLRLRNLVMGVLNVTPDSFSDGGLYLEKERAVEHGLYMIDHGADLLDIGGESSRPGAKRVSADEQLERILPVIRGIRAHSEAPISVDTTRVSVAKEAWALGADMVNDITALRDSPEMADFIASVEGGLILTHMRGTPETMQWDTEYEDVVLETREFLAERAGVAEAAGVPRSRLWIDPGIGFGKSVEGNLEILRRIREYDALGYPVVIGLSRKSFIGKMLGGDQADRLAGTIGLTTAIAAHSVRRIHRVHDVREVADALRMTEAMVDMNS